MLKVRRALHQLGWLVAVVCLASISACGAPAQASSKQQANDAVSAGLSAEAQGRTSEATADFQKALAKDPSNKYAYYDLGYIQQKANQNDSAELDYRGALAIDPNFVQALFNLAILRTGPSPQEAVDLYRHAISVDPNYAAAHLNLGFLLTSLGQASQGKTELNLAVALDPALASRIPSPSPSPRPSASRKP